jgi:hypothetical protein
VGETGSRRSARESIPLIVAKKGKGKKERLLGPTTVAKPALWGAGMLFVVQTAMKVFLKA